MKTGPEACRPSSVAGPEHTFYHYVRVTVDQDQVSTEVVKINKDINYSGPKKYFSIAGLYLKTLGRIYVKYVLIGFFLLVLIVDSLLEYLYQQKQEMPDQGKMSENST